MYGEERLDWCLGIAVDCGRPVAGDFCHRKRFADVVVFRAERVGRAAATRTLGTRQTCSDDDGCTAFAYITCAGPIPRDRVFVNPAWKERRLDWCLRWAAECGRPAADAFCRARGFQGVLHALPDEEPGYASTRVISDDRICNGPSCRGFQQIICR